jgi:hypothetical protein
MYIKFVLGLYTIAVGLTGLTLLPPVKVLLIWLLLQGVGVGVGVLVGVLVGVGVLVTVGVVVLVGVEVVVGVGVF